MNAPLIIDSFAGGGGASTGIEMALGRSPDYAINHSAAALALHEANHPDTVHLDSNIWDVEPTELVQGRPVGLLWASPDCKHFSKAKGGAPRDRNIRDLAWVIVDWAEKVKPDVILMENVEEFKTWGHVGEDGQPVKGLEGTTFELWKGRIKKAGYRIQHRELRGCDYGDPTIRKRLFFIMRRDGRPIVWPKPSHGDPKSAAVKKRKVQPWRTAAECIDWSRPCPSIFDTAEQIKEMHGLRAKRPLAANTMARVARGMQRYVLEANNPYVVELPGGQITAPSVQRFNSGATGQDLRDPLATITANSWIKKPGGAAPLGIMSPVLMNVANSKTTGRGPNVWDVQEPARTITSASGLSIIAPALATFYGHGGGRGKRAASLQEPLRTVTTANRHALIAPVLTYAQQGGRSRDIAGPHHTITASNKDQNAVIAPILVGCGGRAAQSRPRGTDEPTATITAKADTCVAAPFLAQHNKARAGHNPGRAINAPISTLTSTGSQQNVIAPWIAKYYGTGDGARSDEPLHTVTVKDRMGHMQAELAAPEFSAEHHERARQVAEFLRSQGVWDGGEFVTVTIKGIEYVVVDIGMRMLAPRELFNAQGFPSDYVIEGVWHQDGEDWTFKPFTKSQQVSCVGNSVCPGLARALAAANCAHLVADTHPEQKEA